VEFWTRTPAAPAAPAAPRQISAADTSGTDTPAAEPAAETLFDVLRQRDRILIIGGMGSGKSELLKWLCWERAEQGELIILDSHAAPDTWSCGEVIGLGRDYASIENAVRSVCAEQDRRYQQRAAGTQKKFPQMCMVIDEMSILNMFADLSGEFKSLLCECRKVNIKLIIGGQSDRANAMGLRGNYDLMQGFDCICQLNIDESGRHFGTVKIGNAQKNYPHPGIFPEVSQCHSDFFTRNLQKHPADHLHDSMTYLPPGTGEQPVVIEKKNPSQVYDSHEEKKICRMYRDGFSLNEIVRVVWEKQSNGRYTKQIKTVLEKYGMAQEGK
jgi:hypothetical protein